MKKLSIMNKMSIVAGSLLLVLSAPLAFAGPWGRGFGGWGRSPGVCPFWGWLPAGWAGFILSLIFWLLAIAGLVFLFKRLVGFKNKIGLRQAAIQAYDSLVTRYIRGEITREQFEQIKSEIL